MAQKSIDNNLHKMFIPLQEDWHGYSVETVWVKKIEDDLFEICNIPFFANGISLGDAVKVKLDKDGLLRFDKIVDKGNNCTYRFIFEDKINSEEKNKYLNKIKEYGDIEYNQENDIYAISVSKDKVENLYKLLEKLENEGVLDFEEGDCRLRN